MAYKISVSSVALKEIENAIDYYAMYSIEAPLNFRIALNEAYKTLETDPFFRIRYSHVRAIKIKRFPYSLYFIIDENTHTIKVISCFHNKRDPNTRPNL